MGIEKFFSTVNKTFEVISSVELDNNSETNTYPEPITGKYLLIDFNSIIHHTSSKLIEELNQARCKNKELGPLKLDDIEWMIIRDVNNFIITILERIDLNNIELIYIALDGVPSFAKILEQKKRRFVGDFVEKLLENYSLPINWSKNNISPGTVFMDKISKYLNNIKQLTKNKFIKKEDMVLKPKDYEFYSKVKKLEFSDTTLNGEGEMKIFDLINTFPKNDPVLFYSPDADVILLSMISKNINTTILRYDQNNNVLDLINIQKLKKSIYDYCLDRIQFSVLTSIDSNKLIKDIVFIFTLFGNDFVPRCETIQTNLDFLFIIDMYLIILIDHGHLLFDGTISNVFLFNFFTLLSSHEKRLLFRNANQNVFQNYNYANQVNFYIDLLKFQKLNLKSTEDKEQLISKKFGDPFYNLYNNILTYIDPEKMKEIIVKYKEPKQKKFHGCLEFYLMDRNKIYEILQESLKTMLPINSLFTIDISELKDSTSYEKLRKTQYQSKVKKHIWNMKEMSSREAELYLINNKLDKYHHLFNPINEFYESIIHTRKINELFYYQKYFNNDDKKNTVTAYLKGLKWIYQYYFERSSNEQINIDETWYYPYYKTPLFDTIIKYYCPSIIDTNYKPKHLDITPLELLLYITPFRLSDLKKQSTYQLFAKYSKGKFEDETLVKNIREFIEKYPQFFYNLDEIYLSVQTGNLKKNIFDCSHSGFISKCHYQILNYIVPINQFITKLRHFEDYVPVKRPRSKTF